MFQQSLLLSIIVCVHCTMYIVHCTMYIVHCTMYIVQCTMYIVQSSTIQFELYIYHTRLPLLWMIHLCLIRGGGSLHMETILTKLHNAKTNCKVSNVSRERRVYWWTSMLGIQGTQPTRPHSGPPTRTGGGARLEMEAE